MEETRERTEGVPRDGGEAASNLINELEQINETAYYLPTYKVGKLIGRSIKRFGTDMDVDLSNIVAKLTDVKDRPGRANGSNK